MNIHNHCFEDVKSFRWRPQSTSAPLDCPRNLAHSILLNPAISEAAKSLVITHLQRPKGWSLGENDRARLGMADKIFKSAIQELKKLGFLKRTQNKTIQRKGLRPGKVLFGFAQDEWTLPGVSIGKRGTYSVVHSNWPDMHWQALVAFCRLRAYGDDTVVLVADLAEALNLERRGKSTIRRLQPAIEAGLIHIAKGPKRRNQHPEIWISTSEEALSAKIRELEAASTSKKTPRSASKKTPRSASKKTPHHPGQVFTQDSTNYRKATRSTLKREPGRESISSQKRRHPQQNPQMAEAELAGAVPPTDSADGRMHSAPGGAASPKNSAQKVLRTGLRPAMPRQRKADPERYCGMAPEDSDSGSMFESEFELLDETCVAAVCSLSNEQIRQRLRPLVDDRRMSYRLLYGPRLGSYRAMLARIMEAGSLSLSEAWAELWGLLIEASKQNQQINSWQNLAWKVSHAYGNA